MNRLEQWDPALNSLLAHADPGAVREAVVIACVAATDDAGLDNPIITAAMTALDRGGVLVPAERREIDELVQALDEAAWALDEEVQAGTASHDVYASAFRRARAAAAVAAASAGADGSVDALYEAHFAVEDTDALTRRLAAALRRDGLDAG